jgi:hypothetical protein
MPLRTRSRPLPPWWCAQAQAARFSGRTSLWHIPEPGDPPSSDFFSAFFWITGPRLQRWLAGKPVPVF